MASSSAEIQMTASTNSRNLRRDIIIILSIKMSVVLAAAIFVFGPDQRPRIDDTALDRHILDHVSAGKTESPYR
jgi:hypothetical protein